MLDARVRSRIERSVSEINADICDVEMHLLGTSETIPLTVHAARVGYLLAHLVQCGAGGRLWAWRYVLSSEKCLHKIAPKHSVVGPATQHVTLQVWDRDSLLPIMTCD